MQMVLPILAVFIMLVIWLNTLIRRGDRVKHKERENFEAYMRDEHEANFVPHRPIEKELFFHPDPSSFIPEGELPRNLISAQKRFELSAKKDMIVLGEEISNLEIKRRFGGQNLESVAGLEQNATRYFIAANSYAESLIGHGYGDIAKNLLKRLISENCDISKTYMLLCDILKAEGDGNGLRELRKAAEESRLQSEIKDKVVSYIGR